MISKNERENYCDYEYLRYLSKNNSLLSQEVEISKGLVLYIMKSLELKPDINFFKEHFSPYASPFLKEFYPDVSFNDFAYPNGVNTQLKNHDFSLEYKFRKELERYSLEDLRNDHTILARMFLDFKPFTYVFTKKTEEADISYKIRDFMDVFKERFTDFNDMEEYFSKDFFDYIFLNMEDKLCLWALKLTTTHYNVFIFALKSYLLEFALNDWHKNNAKARRLYAKISLLLANMQDFTVEPKFHHRIIPNLLQTNTLDIVCEESKILFENNNPVYLKGLVNKAPTVNLMIAFIYYLKNSSSSSLTHTVAQCLSDGLVRLDNELTKKILSFMNYPAKKDSLFYKQPEEPFICDDINYNALEDMDSFMYFISPKMLLKLNPKIVESYIPKLPTSWGNAHIASLERIMTEKGLARYLNSRINECSSLFEFPNQIIGFMLGRNSVCDRIAERFPNDLEKIFTEMISWEYIPLAHEFGSKLNNQAMNITVDLDVLNSFKTRYLRQDVASTLITRVANINLRNTDYERFYLLVNILRKNINSVGKLSKIWRDHLKNLPVTDLLVNSKNKFFVKTMYFFSLEEKVKFYNVKKQDAKNVLKELSVFFTDKSIPLAWLPSADLSWKEQNETVPGILMTKYNRALNKNIEHRLGVEDFKDMVVSYFDNFLMNSEKNDGIFTNTWSFNPLFVNEHLVSFSKNLPKLLKALEDRPEYYVLVAINSYPEMSGTVMNRLKFALKMKAKDFLTMDIKNILKLDFNGKYNLAEEQFLFLKHKVDVDWEICFKGLVKLVQNVYWTAKNREVIIHAKHIVSLIANTFWQFKTLYSFEVGINQNDNVNYAYLLEPSLFHLLNEDFSMESAHKKNLNLNGKDNFITSFLKHVRYEMGNNDEILQDILNQWIDSLLKMGFIIPANKQDNYLQKAVCAMLQVEDVYINSLCAYFMSYEAMFKDVDRFYIEEHNKEITPYSQIGALLNNCYSFNDGDCKELSELFLVRLRKEILDNSFDKKIAINLENDSNCDDLIEEQSFKL